MEQKNTSPLDGYREHEMDISYTAEGLQERTGLYDEPESEETVSEKKPFVADESTDAPKAYDEPEEPPVQEAVYEPEQTPAAAISKPKNTRKKNPSIALWMAGVVFLSGVSGYLGSTIANKQFIKQNPPQETLSVPAVPIASSGSFSVADVVRHTADSVVEITTESVTRDPFWGQFVSSGAGSGVIVRKDGYIITNYHVIQNANKITVRLRNGDSYSATLQGTDKRLDIAVLKIKADDLHPAVYGDSDQLTVGETAIAIGNPLGELGGTVTSGIISALNRDILIEGTSLNLLQTSAAVNRGNSGGGLFNARGELIGIVNAKSSGRMGSSIEGIGFAIPINDAKEAAEAIIKDGYVKGRIEIGIKITQIKTKEEAGQSGLKEPGIYVIEITKENGFKPGDRIVLLQGKPVTSTEEIIAAVKARKDGDKLTFQVERGGNTFDLTVTLTENKE